jgi:hypothetical protein
MDAPKPTRFLRRNDEHSLFRLGMQPFDFSPQHGDLVSLIEVNLGEDERLPRSFFEP